MSPSEPDDPAPPSPTGVHAQLEQLAELNARGVISDAEFHEKKREILGL
jgi:hypothetical protein